MNGWVLHNQDTLIPEWLKGNLSSVCQSCGSEMMNYYNDGRCTNRKCSNPDCAGLMAAKAEFVHKLLNIGGKGKKTFLKEILTLGVDNHFQLLESKPKVTLGIFLRMHCFEGVDSVWETICLKNQFYTLDSLFAKYNGKYRKILDDNKELLYNNLQYVILEEMPEDHIVSERTKYLTIMITGTPIGYASKEAFINRMNELCKGRVVTIHQATKRQSGVDYLIREPGSSTKGKVEAAKKGGIPIITSKQYISELYRLCSDILSEERGEENPDLIEGGEIE